MGQRWIESLTKPAYDDQTSTDKKNFSQGGYNYLMDNLKSLFLLDPNIIFLNHGSFGATPRPVFKEYQDWQMRLEHQPVLFLGRELDELLYLARQALGEYLNAPAEDLVFIPNATHGVNIVARSIKLEAGNQILTTDHEYGACDYTWEFLCSKSGINYVHQPIPLPVHSDEEILERFWQGVTNKTKVIYVSQITSPTALRMPVEKICERARREGILTVVDAAHAPGQIKIDLQDLGADIVFGNCHKWMLSPKGAAFLFVRKEIQALIEPMVVSWGYRTTPVTSTGSGYVDVLQWTGTRDPSAYLSVPAAIQFMKEHNWEKVRKECKEILRIAVERICDLTDLEPLYPLESEFYTQMGIAPLPKSRLPELKIRLYDEYRVEIPLIQWNDRQFVRISVQGYNTIGDIDVLISALTVLLPQVAEQN
jgi:isopenicillin-N epimerase